MKNIVTQKATGTMAGDVFFGTATVQLHDKSHRFNVCSHLVAGEEMEFRAIGKVKAGWNTIFDFKAKSEQLWYHIGKTTQCVQVKKVFKDGSAHWFDVYNTKGGLWSTVDVLMLDTCTVGDVHCSTNSKMYTHQTFVRTNAKTHACLAFVVNEPKSKAA